MRYPMEESSAEAARQSSTAQARVGTIDSLLGVRRPCRMAAALVSANARGSSASVGQKAARALPHSGKRMQRPMRASEIHTTACARQKQKKGSPGVSSPLIGRNFMDMPPASPAVKLRYRPDAHEAQYREAPP